MPIETIDHNTLARLVEARAVRGTHVVAQTGGWGVVVRYGRTERPLAATRSREVRTFKKLETLVAYLKTLGISRFDIDASGFDAKTVTTHRRPDASAALKRAHAAAAHDKWFRDQVQQAVVAADEPDAKWVPNEVAKAEAARRRAALRQRAAEGAAGRADA